MNEAWFNERIELIAHPDTAAHLAREFECFLIEVRDEIVILDVLILHRLFDPKDDLVDLLIGIITDRHDVFRKIDFLIVSVEAERGTESEVLEEEVR